MIRCVVLLLVLQQCAAAVELRIRFEAPQAQPRFQREVRKFTVPDIRVSNDSLVLQLDFELTVKQPRAGSLRYFIPSHSS